VYLEQVLKETLRLFPVLPLIFRELQENVKIGEWIIKTAYLKTYNGKKNYILVSDDHILPKGTTCIISILGTHHFSELYPNPLKFNPDNFDPENVASRHKYSFIAFSGGPRGCIGMNDL